jgi:eukaryotic-like serine/threonine-protein kinase
MDPENKEIHADDPREDQPDTRKRSSPMMVTPIRPRKPSQPFPQAADTAAPASNVNALPDPPTPEATPPPDGAAGEGGTEKGTPEAPAEPGVVDTVPVAKEGDGEEAPSEGQLLEACPSCGTLIDMTDQEPFAKIHCPSCGQALRARRQFNHYQLVELIGQGGMGHVFMARDCNLDRMVALKVLRKELAQSPEEREKLAEESRITASINHPHVVKVFSFGEDHGQFYMAMELVEKRSLDELMVLQRRVPEAQVLEVGIQIAEGLQAAHERGLLHRDIKPGNILFADAHTAKLVDFGLAIVADKAASAVGEIWGTPYYIAPEKLDNQPEDFRSDIYSLGGTLFHALAGRPPYEADTASMVALKQLKSQPVSLQSFAPEVSSETSYVINRMLAKNAGDRYNSYEELIEHLQYARTKLLERINKPVQPRARVTMEDTRTRTVTAIISLVLLAVAIGAGVMVYAFRDRIFPAVASVRPAASFSAADFDRSLAWGVSLASEQRFDEARAEFDALVRTPGVPQPRRNWARMNLGLATLLAGNTAEAADIFGTIQKSGLYSQEPGDLELANFFIEVSRLLSNPDKPIHERTARLYSNSDSESFALLAFALHDWQLGDIPNALPLFQKFITAPTAKDAPWIADYKPLARLYANDGRILNDLEKRAAAAKDDAARQAVLDAINDARLNIQTGDRASERLDTIASSLESPAAR